MPDSDTTPLPNPGPAELDGEEEREVSVAAPGSSRAKRRRVNVPAAAGRAWRDDPNEEPQLFDFTGTPGVNPVSGLTNESKPLDCYLKFVSKETFENIAVETNRYASSYLAQNPPSPSSPSQKWTRTTAGLYDSLFIK